MNHQENDPKTSDEKKDTHEEGKEQIMATNPNPRANENIKGAPFEKTDEEEAKSSEVGTEITDGEGG
ncbi:MAG: hypothetical protein ABIN57_09865 [Chitinophagaceae bacterium]